MKISQKLKILKQLKRLTQTELAALIGVSFPTINSWINDKSIPHRSKIAKIDEIYAKYTGQKVIPESSLAAKKEIIYRESSSYKNIIASIEEHPDIYDQFVLSLTYNTNSIEGSTLTESETAAILFENVTIKNKDLVEHLEAKNHQSALEYLFRKLPFFERSSGNRKIVQGYYISEEFLLHLHQILMNSIRTDAGNYRNHGVRIVGANVPTANYIKVPKLMQEWVHDIDQKPDDVIRQVTVAHSKFEKIHPFSDGNGRVGRLLITAMLLRAGLPPAVIKQQEKNHYYKFLQKSQQKEEYYELEEFICDAILNGLEILNYD